MVCLWFYTLQVTSGTWISTTRDPASRDCNHHTLLPADKVPKKFFNLLRGPLRSEVLFYAWAPELAQYPGQFGGMHCLIIDWPILGRYRQASIGRLDSEDRCLHDVASKNKCSLLFSFLPYRKIKICSDCVRPTDTVTLKQLQTNYLR